MLTQPPSESCGGNAENTLSLPFLGTRTEQHLKYGRRATGAVEEVEYWMLNTGWMVITLLPLEGAGHRSANGQHMLVRLWGFPRTSVAILSLSRMWPGFV